MKNLNKRIKAAVIATGCSMSALAFPLTNANAKQQLAGYVGDVNQDMRISVADLTLLAQHIMNEVPLPANTYLNADIIKDGLVDIYDLIGMRQLLVGEKEPEGIYIEVPDDKDFISAPIKEVDAGLPSQGDANLVIFYVDFPDCQYSYSPDSDTITKIAFGEEDTSNSNYPFESMHAFYERSSKGAMNLQGQAFRYTAKNNVSYYSDNRLALALEAYEAFDASVDFSQFDGDGDGKIDATLLTVPKAAGDDNWWPCAGDSGKGNENVVDGKALGHFITGNAQIESESNYSNFVSSYLHEMGHCMGLPDYYLYSSADSEGMHGYAGIELMDMDASSDFSAFSKLMLGWYKEDQISVYDSSAGSQTFTLNNAQNDDGNCVIIPCGDLDSQYFSEYFIIEYSTEIKNNSGVNWWLAGHSGIRIHHIKADLQRDYWFTYLKYQNGSEYTNGDDAGIRLIRIVNDTDGDNFFRTGDVVDNSVSGFGWYDSAENESIDPGVSISIGECTDGQYTITISNK